MKRENFNELKPEIQEYIQYMINLGLINSNNKETILDKLCRTEINEVENEGFGARTYHKNDRIIVEVCHSNLEAEAKEFNRDYNEYLDENIFHELTHASSILDDEIEQKTISVFSDLDTNNSCFPNINTHGYGIINEFIAQSIAQKMIAEKYKEKYNDKNPFPKKHCKFTYDENGFLPSDSSFSYEYDSSLNFYGEVEEFALKFIESVYGKKDIERLYNDHFNGDFIEKTANEYSKRKNGIENLYQLFGHMSVILSYDYYQQGYCGTERYNSFTVENFKKSVTEFNRIVDIEIDRQQTL